MNAPSADAATSSVRDVPQWIWIVLLLLLLALLIAVGMWLVRRRRKAAADGPAEAAAPPLELARDFRRFLRRLSWRQRGDPRFVLVGQSRAASSALLARLIDAPVEPSTGPFRFHAVPGALIEELSPELVADDSAAARAELSALFGDAGGAVVLLVSVDAHGLRSEPQSALNELAASIAALVKLLASRAGARVGLRLCVVQLESLPGFEPALGLLLRGAAPPLELRAALEAPAREARLARWEAELPRALLDLEPDRFAGAVRFLDELPRLIAAAAPLARVSETTPLSPALSGIYLLGADAAERLGDPLRIPAAEAEERVAAARRSYFRKSRNLALVASALVVAMFWLHWLWLRRVELDLDQFMLAAEDKAPPAELAARARKAGRSARALAYWGLPWAFEQRRAGARGDFSDSVHRAYLAPGLSRVETDPIQFFYAASLARATRANGFGAEISKAEDWWAERLSMPSATIDDYIQTNDADGRAARFIDSARTNAEPAPLHTWDELLVELERVENQGALGPNELAQFDTSPLWSWLSPNERQLNAVKRVAQGLRSSQDSAEQRVARVLAVDLAFVAGHRPALIELRRVIGGAVELSTPAEPRSLGDLLSAIQAGVPAAPASGGALALRTERRLYRVNPARLQAAFFNARAAVLLERFVNGRRALETPAFFAPDAAFPGLGQKTEPGLGPAQALPGIYTRKAFEAAIAPVLEDPAGRLKALPLGEPLRQRLLAFVAEETKAYAQRYQSALDGHYSSFRFDAKSGPALEQMLEQLAGEGSWFELFVDGVANNAALPLEGLDAAPLDAALAPFAPLVQMQAGKGMKEYGQILLDALAPAAGGAAPAAQAENLAARLSAAGRSALAEAGPDSKAAAERVDEWLRKWRIVGRYRAPFLLPVTRLGDAGRSEVNRVVAEAWEREVADGPRQLFTKFPFDPAADRERLVTVAALEAELGPKGTFWSEFEALIAPIAVRTARGWSLRPSFREPEGMLTFVNAAASFRDRLWGEDGARRALEISVTPLALPGVERNDRLVTLAQLSFGTERAYSFNQARVGKRLKIPWWSSGPSRIQAEITDERAERTERFATLAAASGPYSFLRVLAAATRQDQTWSWELRLGVRAHRIEFELDQDPWAPFTELAEAAK